MEASSGRSSAWRGRRPSPLLFARSQPRVFRTRPAAGRGPRGRCAAGGGARRNSRTTVCAVGVFGCPCAGLGSNIFSILSFHSNWVSGPVQLPAREAPGTRDLDRTVARRRRAARMPVYRRSARTARHSGMRQGQCHSPAIRPPRRIPDAGGGWHGADRRDRGARSLNISTSMSQPTCVHRTTAPPRHTNDEAGAMPVAGRLAHTPGLATAVERE